MSARWSLAFEFHSAPSFASFREALNVRGTTNLTKPNKIPDRPADFPKKIVADGSSIVPLSVFFEAFSVRNRLAAIRYQLEHLFFTLYIFLFFSICAWGDIS